MSFDEEWASARTDATANTAMRLNRVPDEGSGGGGSADLSVSQDKLGEIGSAAYALHGRLKSDGNHAAGSTSDAATMMTVNNFRTGAAMRTVHDTWSSQLGTLLDACANISNHLDYSAASHAREEQEITAALAASRINEYFK
ncbi:MULTISPECIES: hypothetical protein [unclassified Streptomyces]|uniref:hypothetical protein n=1 Tax=unclassified Streptomyces TaxID=2593676 RepID=UPI00081DA04E|nr:MULTISPECIES: hypothetical protein [unclassified Streptomyces]MYZ36526.1 hypothetical protein [Streptomyces sp. SID4917]SCF84306.1 hypothetical protein GA0115259_103495 [Streptomyces sp. MnatMP-M17]